MPRASRTCTARTCAAPCWQRSLNRDASFLDAVLDGVFTVPGDGCVDYPAVLAPIARAKYRGWLVVEAEQDPAVAPSADYADLGYRNLRRFADADGLRVTPTHRAPRLRSAARSRRRSCGRSAPSARLPAIRGSWKARWSAPSRPTRSRSGAARAANSTSRSSTRPIRDFRSGAEERPRCARRAGERLHGARDGRRDSRPRRATTTGCWSTAIADRYRLTPFATHTAPAGAAPFRLAFGSCARHQLDAEQPVFRAIGAAEPDVFFWLGDNIYADSASDWVFAEDYRRQRAIASTLPVMRSVPQLAIWDDHDFGAQQFRPQQPGARGLPRRVQELLGESRRTACRMARASSSSTPTAASISSCWTAATTARPTTDPDGPEKTLLGAAPGRMAARGAAREPRALQGARLRQRLVHRGRPDGRHLGRVPDRAQCALRLHPRQAHRGRVPASRATRTSAK